MYLHLGQSVVVPFREVIGIFDLDNASFSHITRDFLRRAEENKIVVNIAEDLPKSFLLCQNEKGEQTVFLSQLNAGTLLKRVEETLVFSSNPN